MGLTGRLCIRFQTITSEYDQGEPAAGAAGGKHCGDAGLAQCCQLHQRRNVCGHFLRRQLQGDEDLQSGGAMLCDYKEAMSAPLRIPSPSYGGQSQYSPE